MRSRWLGEGGTVVCPICHASEAWSRGKLWGSACAGVPLAEDAARRTQQRRALGLARLFGVGALEILAKAFGDSREFAEHLG